MKTRTPHFSKRTLEFLLKASKQKKPDWLEKNADEYQEVVREPLHHFAAELMRQLRPLAPGYHFPQKGLGRLKRSAHRAKEYGSYFKGWIGYTASVPSPSRFDSNPSLFFMINPEDEEGDEILLAGGLYMPSSRQLKSIRESIAENPEPFETLFKTKSFAKHFPKGFSDERISSRPPRGFDKEHSHLHWLKLQGFFVWKSYSKKEYSSADFPKLVAEDGKQILKLNALLDQAIARRWPSSLRKPAREKIPTSAPSILDRVGEGKIVLPTPDF